jgi:hypothetical protein
VIGSAHGWIWEPPTEEVPVQIAIQIAIRGFLLLVTVLLAAPASALFIPTADGRYLQSSYYSYCPGCGPDGEDVFYSDFDDAVPSPEFSDFTDEVVAGSTWVASQSSTVAAHRLAGVGSASTDTGEEGGAGSTYEIYFDVSDPTPIALSGSLTGASFSGFLFLSLVNELTSDVIYQSDASGVFGAVPLDFAGVLEPGPYRLYVEASFSGANAGDAVGFDFALAAIPEPGTVLMLGLGLAALAKGRRG